MRGSELVSRVGSYSLPLQCVLLCIAVPAISFKLGPPAGWLFAASLLAGAVAVLFGILASIVLRNARWLALSVAAAIVLFFSLLLGMSLGGNLGA